MINKKLLSFDPAAMRYVWWCALPMAQLAVRGFVWRWLGLWAWRAGAGLVAGAWPAAFAVCMISIPSHRLHYGLPR
ncbi:MAG: hypothetical protein ACLTZH_03630 [Subdoligranulum sp.]